MMKRLKIQSALILCVLLSCMGLPAGLALINTPPVLAREQADELSEAQQLNQQVEQLYEQGKYNEAVPLLERVLAIRLRILGKRHPDVVTNINNLAVLHYSQGRYKDAEPLYVQALELRKSILGERHPDVAQSLNNLAAL